MAIGVALHQIQLSCLDCDTTLFYLFALFLLFTFSSMYPEVFCNGLEVMLDETVLLMLANSLSNH